jgi:demethylmenaquinone methyltransferase/2-methoxy-6-polyprenyl-1,4-benzoquinol methylase
MHQILQKFYKKIASTYQLTNHIFTFGMDIVWRNTTATLIAQKDPKNHLDLCCGTGDLAEALQKKNSAISITGIDGSKEMIHIAREKSSSNITYILADSSRLPSPNDIFDSVSISFASRNLNIEKGHFIKSLKEVYRVLKNGGYFFHLETGIPKNRIIYFFFVFYTRFIVSNMGILNSESHKAYQFLSDSTLNFHSDEKLQNLFREAGFRVISVKNWFTGAVALHITQKINDTV